MKSYAKINLTLDILKKREDEYHDIATILQQVTLCDNITFEDSSETVLTCSNKDLENENNLAYKAAILLKEKYGAKEGVNIHIEKNIPVGAGLSGGSSNAALVLKELNNRWNLNLSEKELCALGEKLGMDVPFHILGGTCVGTNRGEEVKRLPSFSKMHVIIVYPGFSISTKEAYQTVVFQNKNATEKFQETKDLSFLHNDFEQVLFQKHPILKEIKERLGKYSLLSGSGSCVFGLFADEKEAKETYQELKKDYTCFLAETIPTP